VFTQHQKKALDFQRHLSVTANAGAGKTKVLVERFLDILLRTGTGISEIVAITFTEKAASELRKKIADVLEQRIRDANTPAERWLLEEIRGNLSSAMIGTIHSFCAQLLREFPVEADVDAAFTILEGVDQQALMQEAIRDTFESIMRRENSSAERVEFLDMIRMFGRTMVQEYLTALMNRREQLERLLSSRFREGKSDEDILNEWSALLYEEIRQSLDDPRWKDALRRVLAVVRGKTAPVVEQLLNQWRDDCSLKEKVELYRSLSGEMFTVKTEFYKKFTGPDVDSAEIKKEEEMLMNVHAKVKPLIDNVGNPESLAAERTLLRVTKIFLRLFNICLGSYQAKKSEFGQLDFEDLQLKAHELLRRNDIHTRIQEKYAYIMVDEFQDTNRLQYEIFLALVAGLRKGNLFIVGDPKQSIYGFRNAEVEVFEEAKSAILSSSSSVLPFRWNTGEITSSDEERKGSITLTESFRLLPNVAAFVNKVFRRLMSTEVSRFDVRYDELVKARKAAGSGTVEMLLIPGSDGDSEEESIERSESRMIAGRIEELIGAKHQIYDNDGVPHDITFGDIAILFRKRLHIRAIEQALVEFNIPYALSGGIGYYQTQEILDFNNYFKFLLNPGDDIALAGILRSPFFGISDAELFEISIVAGKESFWKKMELYVNRQEATKQLRRAVTVLRDDLLHANRMPIPFLVQKIFLQTGWQGTVAGLALGRQHTANIHKLLSIAREFEGKGFLTLYDFVQRLKTLIDDEDREGQATIEKEKNAVRVMTIHAAKGLEFPVVVLPFTHEKFRYDQQPFIDASAGVAFKVRNETDYNKEMSPPLYHYLLQRSKQKTQAEEKRILYVACTRAQDMLIISGRDAGKRKHPSYLSWILEGLGIETATLRSETKFFSEKLNTLERHQDEYRRKEIDHQLAVALRVHDDSVGRQPVIAASSGATVQPKEILVEPLRGQTWGQFFSATHIKTFLECPTKYYLKYHLGLPEQHAVPYDFDENEEPNDKLRGELIGTLTHAALQKISSGTVSENEVKNIVASLMMSESAEPNDTAILGHVTNQVINFVSSSFGNEVLAASESKTEFSLSMIFDKDFLTGTIDRLYKDHQGNWNIVDYKTDQISPELIQSRSDLYKPQLAFYALLVRQFSGQEKVRASLVFLRHPDSPVHVQFNGSEIDSFAMTVREVILKIKSENFDRMIHQCTMCTYRDGKNCIIPPIRLSSPKTTIEQNDLIF
jgi:ATP-dependent helicase/nuclease subunit A